MSADKETEQGEVGYCRPPAHRQFKKGQSGNPNGRPRKSAEADDTSDDMAKIIEAEAARTLKVLQSGKSVQLSTKKAMVRRLFMEAVKGNLKAIPLAMKLIAETHATTARRQAREALRNKTPIDAMEASRIYQELMQRTSSDD